MKKTILVLGLAAGSIIATAQDHVEDQFHQFKPTKGSITTEAGLTGGILDSDFKLNDATGSLRGRYFLKNDLAIRAGLNISYQNDVENFYSANQANKGFVSTAESVVMLNVGIEKHFKGTARLSPYVGGDILLGNASASEVGEKTDGDQYVANQSYSISSPLNFTFGVRGVIGADYYIAPKVFIGGEIGLSLQHTILGETTVETTTGTTTVTDKLKSPGSSFSISPNVITGVRIGFVF